MSERVEWPSVAVLLILAVAGGAGCERSGHNAGTDPFRGLETHRVEEEPALSIGAVQGAEHELFGRIRRVALVSDSVLGVLDGGANAVRFFDLGGDFLSESGGPGEGPGELAFVSESWVDEDGSIGVIDLALRRVTRYRGDGGFDLLDHPQNPVAEGGASRHFGRTGGHWLVITGRLLPEPPRGQILSSVVGLRAIGPSGAGGEPIDVPAMPWYMTRDGRFVRLPAVLSPIPRVDINRGVGGVLDPANARVLIHAGSGRWDEVSLPQRCPPVPEEFFEDSAEGTGLRAEIPLSEFREVAPTCRPAYDHLAVSSDGLLWVRLTRDGGENEAVERWFVIDPEGKPMRGVFLPTRFTPMDIRDGVVYGRWLDSLEVNYVKGLRLLNPWEQ